MHNIIFSMSIFQCGHQRFRVLRCERRAMSQNDALRPGIIQFIGESPGEMAKYESCCSKVCAACFTRHLRSVLWPQLIYVIDIYQLFIYIAWHSIGMTMCFDATQNWFLVIEQFKIGLYSIPLQIAKNLKPKYDKSNDMSQMYAYNYNCTHLCAHLAPKLKRWPNGSWDEQMQIANWSDGQAEVAQHFQSWQPVNVHCIIASSYGYLSD